MDAARLPMHASWEWHASRRSQPIQWKAWDSSNRRDGHVRIALWLPFSLSAAATTLLWLTRRPCHGRCLTCGYSLTGLPKYTPCPECGRAR